MHDADQERQDLLARKVIWGLLEGHAPDATAPQACGRWAGVVAALARAQGQGGTAQVKALFHTLAKANPDLILLVAEDPVPVKTSWTVAELYDADFPEPQWAVSGLVPAGLSFLAGRPKIGKSWFALQVACAVGTGGSVLDRQVDKGCVLFLALEDNPRRLKERQSKQGVPRQADITFKTTWPFLGQGGLTDLQAELEEGKYTLVVIDTLRRALGRADEGDPSEMTLVLGELQRMAQLHDLAILLIDHHRKPSGFLADPVDDILGSTAKAAVADAALGLYRSGQGKRETTLKATGRDIDEVELALEWDGQTCCWQLLGEAGEVRKDTVNAEVREAIAALVDLGQVPSTARIARYLGKRESHVSRSLGELMNAGLVVRGDKIGREVPYTLPG
jgi:DNA-binding transcriptional ArsR family regulator